MGVGFLHGFLPQGISNAPLIRPTKIRVLTTDELLFPKEMQTLLEDELRVKFEVMLTRDWNTLLAKTVASPSVDLLFLPSYWAATLRQQDLLANLTKDAELMQRVAPDFLESASSAIGNSSAGDNSPAAKTLDFLPIYWIKTGFLTTKKQSFEEFLKDKNKNILFLLADEDLILRHLQIWKGQGLSAAISSKKILTLPLEQISKSDRDGVVETSLNELHPELQTSRQVSALLMWGAAIPNNSRKKEKTLEVLNLLTTPLIQEKFLMAGPFNSTLMQVSDQTLPKQRRATYIRELQLKDTSIIDKKDIDAKSKLKSEFGIIL